MSISLSRHLICTNSIAGSSSGVAGWLLILEDKDVEPAVFLSLLVLDLEVELLYQFLPVPVGEVSTFDEIVAPFGVLVVVELHYIG